MRRWVRGVLTAVAALACGAGAWLMFTRNEALREALALERLRDALLTDVARLESRLAQAVEHLPVDERDPAWYRTKLRSAIAASRLRASDWTEAPLGEQLGEWALHRVSFHVSGRFPDVTAFVGWLERAAPRARVERIVLERGPRTDVRASVRLLVPAPPEGTWP